MVTMDEIWQLIVAERQRQIAKWGKQVHANGTWLLILTEELGEASKSLLEEDRLSGAEELIQAAAVIVAWLEDMLGTQAALGLDNLTE
jgi:hypothetical protein